MKKVLSTAGMSAQEALECWMDDAARPTFRYETKPLDPNNFFAELHVGQLADLQIFEWWLAPRSNSYAGDGEFYVLGYQDRGYTLETDGSVFKGTNRDLYLLGGDKQVHSEARGSHGLGLRVQRNVLEQRCAITSDMVNRPIPIKGDALLLARYFRGVISSRPSALSLAAKASVRDHVLDLVTLTVARAGSSVELASPTSMAMVRVHAAIESELLNPRATREQIAAKAGYSERHINRLLTQEGTSIKQLLIEQRLVKARELLVEWSGGGGTIHELASRFGFNDADSFRQAFKDYYGETPADFRARRHPMSQKSG